MSDWRLLIRRTGGPEVIEREAVDLPPPGPGEVLVRHEAIGLNFIDTYHRSGLYPLPLPSGLGIEAAGVAEAVGAGVATIRPGDRVAYPSALGAYATARTIAADRLVVLPADISTRDAAATLAKGLTAGMLIFDCGRVAEGQWVLVHAAAGGVGALLVPWLKAVGARVIAHAGTPAKAERARLAGADHASSAPLEALAEEVRAVTAGRGCDVVLDGVGRASWTASLDAIARRGILVSFGNASGAVPPVAPLELARRGSLTLVRPVVNDYVADAPMLRAGAARLFEAMRQGRVPRDVGAEFALADAADAHRALEGRQTRGSTLLLP